MTLHHSLTFSIGLLIASTQIQAHEFWIEPSDHYTDVNQTIDITLKVGETFRGSAQPYLPEETANFVLINQTKQSISGLLGDSRPAARAQVSAGLNQLIHQTTPFSIRFGDGDERWANYIALDGLEQQLNQHVDLPKTVPVTERYVRCAKSLIQVGGARVEDTLTGEMPFEFVLNGSWSQLNTGNYQVTLFEQQTPLEGVLVKAFRHSDRQVVAEAYTDQDGQVNLNLPTADRYLLSGVVIRPDTDPNYDWISHWPSLTIEVVN